MKKEKKIKKTFVDYGCGFPVVMSDVPMVRVRGVWTPDINYEVMHKTVLCALACKPVRLTGNDIKFIRNYFELTLVDFGEYFDVSHPAVLKWENAGDDPPSIKWSLERDLRLFIFSKLGIAPEKLGILYQRLASRSAPPRSNKLDISKIPDVFRLDSSPPSGGVAECPC